MAPYRTVSRDDVTDAPRDAGIVGDIIAQFADPLAFYRELVQNSIDAGTPAVEIELTHDAGIARVAVRDRGEGMTRDVLENQLLVLFRSTKEQDRSKIGKFGIGFASVLAPNPEVVIVQTARDGRRLVLHLRRDLSYQLYDGGPATQPGTVVELELAISIEQARELAHHSHAALLRWCRHATVPIHLIAALPGLEPPIRARIDSPLGLEHAIVEVRETTADGQLTAIVGITADARPYTGFFNHGLMLHETRELLFGNVAVKLQDARLGHTLSRDNVRRDDSFERALELARRLVTDVLPVAIARQLQEAATAADPLRYQRLVDAVATAGLALDREVWHFPLVEPVLGQTTVRGDGLGRRAWTSDRRSAITATLAAAGHPVLHLASGGAIGAHLRRAVGATLVDVEATLTLVTPLDGTPGDH
ncbi:MAG: ATP-binding protein, partial [Myxococcota bacterium]|nr:ATP-binding protein [Myxococcota bacterium]